MVILLNPLPLNFSRGLWMTPKNLLKVILTFLRDKWPAAVASKRKSNSYVFDLISRFLLQHLAIAVVDFQLALLE